MMKKMIFLTFWVVMGCTRIETPRQKQAIASLWLGEHNLTMIFEVDNNLVFKNGFTYLMPARWTYNSANNELTLYLSELDSLLAEELLVNNAVKKYDLKAKSITYSFSSQTESINFLGWMFYKQ